MLAFLIFMVAGGQLIARQFHALTDQEQRERAFQVAEAGVHYVLWELNHAGQLPASLPTLTNLAVLDPSTGNPVGTFDISLISENVGTEIFVSVTASGRAENSLTSQVIVAGLRSSNNSAYYIDTWDHQL